MARLPAHGIPNENGVDSCPWCKSSNCKKHTLQTHMGTMTRHFIRCLNCGAQGPYAVAITPDLDDMANAERAAIRHWNATWARATPPPQDEKE
jgi:hypothetical protein